MASPLSSANAMDINFIQQAANVLPLLPGIIGPVPEARLRLLSSLQTSLHLEEILQLFKSELDPLINSGGMCYRNDALNIRYEQGFEEQHHCSYQLITQRDHLGELLIYRDRRFNDQELVCIETLMNTLLAPLRNALLYRLALAASLSDPLTGAGNRAALSNHLNRELGLARRYGHKLSVMMIDIDKFKLINDTHGHAMGDSVLQELVTVINRVNRSTDLCFRYGGEEFVVLLSNTGLQGAHVIAKRLCDAVSQNSICSEGKIFQISISIGISSCCETDSEDSLLNRADKAMYQAKNKGGNDVCSL